MRPRAALALAAALAACSPAPSRGPVAQEPIVVAPAQGDAGSRSLPPIPNPSFETSDGDPLPNEKDTRAVAKMLTKVSEMRGVAATRAVPGVKLAREQLAARVKQKALREYPAEALRREGMILQLMRFAPPGFDYMAEMMRLLEARLEGFYEPKNGTMYLASELKGLEAQATLAHELVHALQDMSWDLKSRSTYRPGKGDETLALACLAEGDATSLMMDYLLAPQTAVTVQDDVMRDLMEAGMATADLKTVPHVLKTSLVAPYVEGLAFVNALRRKSGWDGVNDAWRRPPTSTEQILHVDKWESSEAPLAVPAPTAGALGAGWKRDDEDTLGELGLALDYEEWVDHDTARAAASGWGGDRAAVFTKGDEIALAVHARFDEGKPKADALAERAWTRLAPGLQKKLGAPALSDKAAICFERADTGPLLFARKERELVMIAGPARTGKVAWSSSSTCATARKWADEILAQR